jgi:hypothetical protein
MYAFTTPWHVVWPDVMAAWMLSIVASSTSKADRD